MYRATPTTVAARSQRLTGRSGDITVKNAAFWPEMSPRGSCTSRRFGVIYRPHLQGEGI
jgi:hypothetical protein